MKKMRHTTYRVLILLCAIFVSLGIQAATNSISVKYDKTAIISGESLTATITFGHRDLTTGETILSTIITRTLNGGTPVTIVNNLTSPYTDTFIPTEVRTDQTVKYTISYTFINNKGIENVETAESDVTNFEVFSQPEEPEYNGFEDRNLCTYVDGKTRTYSVTPSVTGNPNGWKYTWKLGENEVSTDKTYTFDPADEMIGDKTLTLTCANYGTDGTTLLGKPFENTYTITVYNKPEKEIQTPTYQTSYVGMEFDKPVTITGSENSGNWLFTINGDSTTEYTIPVNNVVSGIDVPITWKSTNPRDDSEEWISGKQIFTYTVYPKPEDPNIMWSSSNYVLTSDSTFTLSATPSGGNIGGWEYQWSSTGTGKFSSSKDSLTTYQPSADDCGKKIRLSLNTINKGFDGHILYERKTFDAPKTLEVYNRPSVTNNDIHQYSSDKGNTEYTIYVGDTFDMQKLFTYNDGFDTSYAHDTGWKISYKVDKNPSESIVQSDVPGDKKLSITITNTATLSDGSITKWLEESTDYTLKIIVKPDTTTNLAQYKGKSAWNLLSDEETTLEVTPQGGGEDENWSYKWMKNGQEIEGETKKEYTFSGNNIKSDNTKDEYKIEAIITNKPANLIKEAPQWSISQTFYVWAKPEILNTELSTHSWTMETFATRPEKLSVNRIGGAPENWVMSWTPDAGSPEGIQTDPTSSVNSCTYAFDNGFDVDQEKKTYGYTIRWTYKDDNGIPISEYDDQSQPVSVIVWPTPTFTANTMTLGYKWANRNKPTTSYDVKETRTTINCYSNDSFTYNYTITGGYTSEAGTWTLNDGTIDFQPGVPMSHTDSTKFSFIADGSGLYTPGKKTLRFVNKYNGEYYTSDPVWFDETRTINANTYRTASIETALTDSTNSSRWVNSESTPINVYAGGYDANKVNFKINKYNGHPGNWEYDWKEDDDTKSTQLETWTYTPVLSSEQVSINKKFTVHITNHIADNYDIDTTLVYNAIIWHRSKIDDDYTLTDLEHENRSIDAVEGNYEIRNGNTMKVYTDATQFGYTNNSYKYLWSGTITPLGTQLQNEWTWPATCSSSDSQSQNTYTLSGDNQNYGPYGNVWDGKVQPTKTIIVYNKPKTPKSLTLKGNGTTGTYICTIEVTDADLEKCEYYLNFHYRDASGIEHDDRQKQANPGQVRWNKNMKGATDVYVYATWHYPDGPAITSGKRTVSATDENWDGSIYERSAITRAGYEYSGTGIEDVYTSDSQSSTASAIYTLNGKRVCSKNLCPGIYVREHIVNGVKTTEKVYIK